MSSMKGRVVEIHVMLFMSIRAAQYFKSDMHFNEYWDNYMVGTIWVCFFYLG